MERQKEKEAENKRPNEIPDQPAPKQDRCMTSCTNPKVDGLPLNNAGRTKPR